VNGSREPGIGFPNATLFSCRSSPSKKEAKKRNYMGKNPVATLEPWKLITYNTKS
jgi:hypothetical protein